MPAWSSPFEHVVLLFPMHTARKLKMLDCTVFPLGPAKTQTTDLLYKEQNLRLRVVSHQQQGRGGPSLQLKFISSISGCADLHLLLLYPPSLPGPLAPAGTSHMEMKSLINATSRFLETNLCHLRCKAEQKASHILEICQYFTWSCYSTKLTIAQK